MNPRPSIRFATKADTSALVEMISHSLGPGMNHELWRWKHLDNPFGPSPVLVAESGSEIVAVRAFMRWSWESGGRIVPAVRAVDTATRPEWRRQGLFATLTRRLAEHCQEQGVSFVFNTPNRSSLPGYLKLGWSRVGRVPVRLRPRLGRIVNRLMRGGGDGVSDGESPGSPFPRMERLLERPELEALLSGSRVDDTRYRTPRTPRYLAWRYAEAPALDYRAAWSFEAGAGAAVVFRSKTRGRFREILISELLTTGRAASRRLGASLLGDVLSRSGADYAVALGAAGTAAAEALTAARFLPAAPAGPQLTVRPLAWSGETPDPLSRHSWCCSLGDLEVF